MSALFDAQPEWARDDLRAALKARDVAISLLLEFDFASGPVRLCNWVIPVTDGRWGHTWLPGPDTGQIQDVETGADNWAPLREYSVFAPLDLLREFGGEDGPFPDMKVKANYQDRDATLYMQVMRLGEGEGGSALAVGFPIVLHRGRMDAITARIELNGVDQRLRVEGFLARKGVQGSGLMTPRDQKRRFPGDLGLDYVPELEVRPAVWPDF